MNQNPPNYNEEIDLATISRKINSFFERIAASVFNTFLFIRKNLLILGCLLAVGFVAGYILDKTIKIYNTELIVTPNFNSTEYLYSKVALLSTKLKEDDTIFLKAIGIQKPEKLMSIKIDPIVDIYNLVNEKSEGANRENRVSENFELVKLLSESSDIKSVIKDPTTSRNYPRHMIQIVTRGRTTPDGTVKPILKFLNDNSYYRDIQKAYINNVVAKMKENRVIIDQINVLLNQFSNTTANSSAMSDKLVYYNDNTQLNQIIATKNMLVTELGEQRVRLIDYNKVISDNSSILNIKVTSTFFGRQKVIIPLLLVCAFLILSLFKGFYRTQMNKRAK